MMFLPATLELMHPKDAGPRLINDSVVITRVVQLTNIEEDHILGSFHCGLAGLLDFIPNLETLFE